MIAVKNYSAPHWTCVSSASSESSCKFYTKFAPSFELLQSTTSSADFLLASLTTSPKGSPWVTHQTVSDIPSPVWVDCFFPYVHIVRSKHRLNIERLPFVYWTLQTFPYGKCPVRNYLLVQGRSGFAPLSLMRCQAHLFCTRPENVFTAVWLTGRY